MPIWISSAGSGSLFLSNTWMCPPCFQVTDNGPRPFEIHPVDAAAHEERLFAKRQLNCDRPAESAFDTEELSPAA